MGTDRGDLGPGLRSTPFGSYLIFFKAAPGGVQIVRVLHGMRGLPTAVRRGAVASVCAA
jgi:toxin ParE1/3/4